MIARQDYHHLRGLITVGSGDTNFGKYEDILRVRRITRCTRQRQGLVLLDEEDHFQRAPGPSHRLASVLWRKLDNWAVRCYGVSVTGIN